MANPWPIFLLIFALCQYTVADTGLGLADFPRDDFSEEFESESANSGPVVDGLLIDLHTGRPLCALDECDRDHILAASMPISGEEVAQVALAPIVAPLAVAGAIAFGGCMIGVQQSIKEHRASSEEKKRPIQEESQGWLHIPKIGQFVSASVVGMQSWKLIVISASAPTTSAWLATLAFGAALDGLSSSAFCYMLQNRSYRPESNSP